jgi:hypothetical protein
VAWGLSRLERSATRLRPAEYLFGTGDYAAWHEEYCSMMQTPDRAPVAAVAEREHAGAIRYSDVMRLLAEASPGYLTSAEASQVDEDDGQYIHMLHFVLYLIRMLSERKTETFPEVFGVTERILADGDGRAWELVMAGFVEDLTNGNHYRDVDVKPSDFLTWYRPMARQHEYVQELVNRPGR